MNSLTLIRTPRLRRALVMGALRLGTWTMMAWLGTRVAEPAWGAPRRAQPAVEVTDLRCEYLKDPLGLDVAWPRLSWKLVPTDPAERGQRQRSYRILVASRADLLARQVGDAWDSGEVGSEESFLVPYRGRPLRSGMECFWKVQVRDQRGLLSAWSAPARWTMGLLHEGDWTARWIGAGPALAPPSGTSPGENTLADPWFRKSFYTPEVPVRATAYVGSIGYHELYVNGVKVTSAVLAPSVTDLSKRARYVTYEIADYLRPGTNVIGLWLGVGWSIFPKFATPDKPRAPLVIAQIDLRWRDGKMARLGTDATWKTHPSPNRLLGAWQPGHFGGELYDATQELTNWCEAGLNLNAWQDAKEFRPKVLLSADKVEPNRRVKELRPLAIEEVSPGVYRADLGVNFAGMVELDVRGKPGSRVDLLFSERADAEMTHGLRSAYIIGPSGQGTFRHRFNYAAGRWITLKGLAGKPALSDLRVWQVRTDFERVGHFASDHKLFNDIYATTAWTLENLSLGGYLADCPHRERLGSGGQAHATLPAALNTYHVGALGAKWAEDWRDAQGGDGQLPHSAPTYLGRGGPAWSGLCVTLPWEVYRRYGDRGILEANFLTMLRWLAFLESKATNHLLHRWGGDEDSLGDWLWPGAAGASGDRREALFFNNCYWVYCLETVARVAEVLGQAEAAVTCRARAEAVRQAVHAEFFQSKDSSYVNGWPAYLALALFTGVTPEYHQAAVWKRLEDEIRLRHQGHFWAGVTGGAFLLKTLLEAEHHDLICQMAAQTNYPGWGDMLRQGATTFWESWENNPGRSSLHGSFLFLSQWFHEGLAGIRPDPDSGGFKHFVIKPVVVPGCGPKQVDASFESPYGRITVAWEVGGGQLHLQVAVPPNTTATCYVPTSDTRTVEESGRPQSQVPGIQWQRNEDGRVVLRLQPGRYQFTAKYEFLAAP